MHDPVNHPVHYTSHPSGIECIQITEHMNFCLGNAIKYIWRADSKNGIEDLEKARWYLDREIARRADSYKEFPGLDIGGQPFPPPNGIVYSWNPPPAAKCGSCGHDSDYHILVSKYNDATGKASPDAVSCAVCGCQQKQPATLEICSCGHPKQDHNIGVSNGFEWSNCQVCDCYITKPLSDSSTHSNYFQDTELHHHPYDPVQAMSDLIDSEQTANQPLGQ